MYPCVVATILSSVVLLGQAGEPVEPEQQVLDSSDLYLLDLEGANWNTSIEFEKRKHELQDLRFCSLPHGYRIEWMQQTEKGELKRRSIVAIRADIRETSLWVVGGLGVQATKATYSGFIAEGGYQGREPKHPFLLFTNDGNLARLVLNARITHAGISKGVPEIALLVKGSLCNDLDLPKYKYDGDGSPVDDKLASAWGDIPEGKPYEVKIILRRVEQLNARD